MTSSRHVRQRPSPFSEKRHLPGKRPIRRVLLIAVLTISFLTLGSRSGTAETQLQMHLPSDVHQGEPFFFRVTSSTPLDGAQIEWLNNRIWVPARKVADQWIILALFGVGLDNKTGDFPFQSTVSVSGTQVEKTRYISVVTKTHPTQRLTLPPKMVTPDPVSLARIKQEASQIRAAIGRSSSVQYWWPDFIRPVPGNVSSPFGARRIINNEKRAPHRGVDFRGKIGTPVQAWSAGNVILIGDHYFGGLSIYLDHGLGVISSYLHLSKIKVAEGDFIYPGQIIGLVGATGRSTAPHLHFGLSVQGQWVDPLLLLNTGK